MINRRKFIKDTTLTTGLIISAGLGSETDNNNIVSHEEPSNTIAEMPFIHGVASGDPLSNQVIIWTRINPEKEGGISLKWSVAKDEQCTHIIQSGESTTDENIDYTVKINVEGLQPSTTYYYRFAVGDKLSPIGRTKTTVSDGDDAIQLAVVSCSNYSAGYYNAFARIAEKKNLNAVLHLGDYIYEGTERIFDVQKQLPEDDYESTHFNRTRDWWLHYYRKRYSINRLDADLQAAHQAHPFITIWDDHEIANNAWKDGAQGHEPDRDGDWETRKSAARQAYAEWMPIRGDAKKIYRSIRFGKMAELILLDTRLEGRDQQIYNADNAEIFHAERTLLGKEQKHWLYQQLSTSDCQWKLMANQVVFSEFNVAWANLGGQYTDKVKQLQETLLDYWEGYPAERDEIISHLKKEKLDNVIIMSASMHCALAFDVTLRASNYSRKKEKSSYDPITGNGSVAVEFAATSISSENFDEIIGRIYANMFESLINKKLPPPLNYNPNPHLKYVDLQRHGYYVLKITKERAEADFYFMDSIQSKSKKELLAATYHTKTGKNRLERSHQK